MATERLTNGTFASSLTGWTSTESESETPGVGPAANGDIAWSSSQSGAARIRTNANDLIAYDGAIYQSIGEVVAAQSMRLSGTLWRRAQGSITSGDVLTAIVWRERVSTGETLPMLIVRTSNWVTPRRYIPSPIEITTNVTASNVFQETTFDYDVSNFFENRDDYRIWLSADIETGSFANQRNEVWFGTVSLMDYGSPASTVTPTTSRAVVADSEQSITVNIGN